MIAICPHCGEVFESIRPTQAKSQQRIDQAQSIITLCSDQLLVKRDDVLGHRRKKNETAARHLAMYLIRRYCAYSYKDTGKLFDRDHTVVIHAEKRVKNSIFTKADLFNDLVRLQIILDHEPHLKVAS
jgi:chromosomal replication initiator protein